MKKLAVLLAGIMLLSLTACGGEKTNNPDTPSSSDNVGGANTIETALFTLSYGDDWNYFVDYTENEDDYCFATLQVPDPDDPDYYLIDAEIEVSLEDPYDFREDLVYYGFNQYEYEVNKAYKTENIGGVDLLRYDDGDEEIVYLNRIESAGATIAIEFDAEDINDSRIAELLKGLTFTLKDTGNVDGPWAWEGERFSTEDHSVNAGAFTLNSKFIPFEEYVDTYETFNHAIAVTEDRIYVLIDGELRECHYDGTVLAFVNPIELPEDDYETITATADGTLWLSGSMNDILCIKDGAIVKTYEDIDNLAIHPSGAWGVNYFVSNECSIVTFNGDSYSTTPVVYNEVDTIMNVNVDENNVYVCASAADDSGHKVFIYNKEGVLQKTLCDAEGEGLGSVTFVTQTSNGYIGFDGNMRDVLLWDNNGAFVAEISSDELFDAHYPWFCSSTVAPDGNIYTVMTSEREDESATEVIVFQVNGF